MGRAMSDLVTEDDLARARMTRRSASNYWLKISNGCWMRSINAQDQRLSSPQPRADHEGVISRSSFRPAAAEQRRPGSSGRRPSAGRFLAFFSNPLITHAPVDHGWG
jgi:hypothetical protein